MPLSEPQTTSTKGEELGRLLSDFRAARGLAQKQAAQFADIDGSTLSRLEKGERGVSREVLDRICAVLELDRRQRLDVLVAAGFLTEEAARFLADEELSRLANLLTDGQTQPEDAATLRQFVQLALTYAAARGY